MKTYEDLVTRFPWAKGRGQEYGNGWTDLIFRFCEEVEECYNLANKMIDFAIFAIKEKNAELRIQFDKIGSVALDDLERKYEELSTKTCETCGEVGVTREVHGWLSVACDACCKSPNKEVGVDEYR